MSTRDTALLSGFLIWRKACGGKTSGVLDGKRSGLRFSRDARNEGEPASPRRGFAAQRHKLAQAGQRKSGEQQK